MNDIRPSLPGRPLSRPAAAPAQPADDGPADPGFPVASPGPRTGAQDLHDVLSGHMSGAYGWSMKRILKRLSATTEADAGLNVGDLVAVERNLYQGLSNGPTDSAPNATPLFQALGDKAGAYVDLGPQFKEDSDHLMREWSGLPPATLQRLGPGSDALAPVRQALLDRAANHQFPVFIDLDGNFNTTTPTESIATESIASMARRENHLGGDIPDPSQYYQWLTQRVQSQYSQVDPWLYAANRSTHDVVDSVKTLLTPPWLTGKNENDPFGFGLPFQQIEPAYQQVMGVCGGGQPVSLDTYCNIADMVTGLDRDLLSGVQTYWAKLIRELPRPQRESLFLPLARTWVKLNTLAPDAPAFDQVAPATAPPVTQIDPATGKAVQEQHDRSMALSEAVDHTLDGLGISERQQLVGTLMDEIRAHRPQIEAREARLRASLGSAYQGLDVDGLLDGTVDGTDPKVQQALQELKQAAPPGVDTHPYTPERAEIQRQYQLLNWVANREDRYGEVGVKLAGKVPQELARDPLVVSEFYIGDVNPRTPMTPLPTAQQHAELLGHANGQPPTPVSIVLQGGGGKGFAYAEVLRQTRAALDQGPGQYAIDEYVGNSAGALTAGLLAAGYTPDELAAAQHQMDFKSFYGDYLWLMGGVDPKVRGVDRSGLFSQQQMYQTMSALLKAKVPVKGRPVLFRDLPFKLRVTSTVLNTDLPEDLKKQLGIGPDGQIVFSSETTPNMDVAAAISCSAAVEGFFNAPQLEFFRNEGGTMRQYRMQLADGGCVNNFPVHEVSRQSPSEKQAMVVMPVFYQAPNADGTTTSLSTLNFDQGSLSVINKYNDERYPALLKGLPQFVETARQSGEQRLALAFHLTDLQGQQTPALQGRTVQETDALQQTAQQAGFQVLSPQDSANVVNSCLPNNKLSYPQEVGLDELLGKDHVLEPRPHGQTRYNPPTDEAAGISDMLLSVLSAQIVAGDNLQSKQFEAGRPLPPKKGPDPQA